MRSKISRKTLLPFGATMILLFGLLFFYTNCSPFEIEKMSASLLASEGTEDAPSDLPDSTSSNPETVPIVPVGDALPGAPAAPPATTPVVTTPSPLPVGTGDDLSLLRAMIDRINPSVTPISEIRLEARDYILNCPSVVAPAPQCLSIVNKGNLSIIGVPGKTRILLSNPRTGFMYAKGMGSLKLENLVIDYTTPPFLQARIAQVSATQFRIQVSPGFLDFSHPALAQDLLRSRAVFFWIVNPATGAMIKDNLHHHIPIDIRTRPPIRVGNTAEWIINVDPAQVPNLTTQMAAGDFCLLGSRIDEGVGVLLDGNANVEIKNVTLHSAPHMGVFAFETSGSLRIDGLKITPKPGSTRLASVVADALHLLNNRAQIEIKNSVIEGMGDDAINIQSYAANVGSLAGLGPNEIRIRPSVFTRPYKTGDVLQVVGANNLQPRFGAQNEPRIVQSQAEGAFYRLVIDRPRPTSVVENDFVYNVNLAGVGSQITNNYFGPFRGGFRLRSPGGVFSNNQFADLRNLNIFTMIDAGFPMEGPITGLAANSNNVLAQLPPQNDSGRMSVYRYNNPTTGRHHLGLRSNIPSLNFEGEAFQLGAVQVQNYSPLYSCHSSPGVQFLSTNAGCEGLGGASLLGFIRAATSAETPRALVRCYNPIVGHIATINPAECTANGYTVESTLGFVR